MIHAYVVAHAFRERRSTLEHQCAPRRMPASTEERKSHCQRRRGGPAVGGAARSTAWAAVCGLAMQSASADAR